MLNTSLVGRIAADSYRYHLRWSHFYAPAVAGGGDIKQCRDPSVCLSVPPKPPELCGLWIRPRTDADPPGHIVSPRDNLLIQLIAAPTRNKPLLLLLLALRKCMKRSRCRLWCGLGWTQATVHVVVGGPERPPREGALSRGHSRTCPMLNVPSLTQMFVKRFQTAAWKLCLCEP